jgi:predicted nucleotidyltransferase
VPSSVAIEWGRSEPRERRERFDAEVRRVTAELVRRGASLVVLFGSRARGEAGPLSDADVLAVLPLPQGGSPIGRWADLYAEIVPVGIDLLVYTAAEFEQMKRESSLVRRALAEGVVLHGG